MTERAASTPGPPRPWPSPAAALRLAPASLPSEVDPTVFDEAFLRQLERLLLLMRVAGPRRAQGRAPQRQARPVGRVRRLPRLHPGDDLRQLDWNVYARLERLFVKLFIEEEDVTVTLLVDASASMATGPSREAGVRQARGAALGYIGLASEDRVAVSALAGGWPRRRTAAARLGPGVPPARRPVRDRAGRRPTDLVAAARHAAAQLHGRGSVIVLLSDLLDPAPTGSSASSPRPAPS